jgi:hypothetical protein
MQRERQKSWISQATAKREPEQEASPSNPQVRSDTDFLIKQVFHRGSESCLMELFCRKKSGYRIKRDGVSGNDTDFRSGRNNRFALYQNLLQQRTLH